MIAVAKKMTWQEFREMELEDDDNFIYVHAKAPRLLSYFRI